MEINGNTLVFVIVILFLFFSTPGGDGVSSQYEFNQLQRLKQQFRTEHDAFLNMTYTDNFRNITGFKLSYQDMLNNPLQNATYPLPGKEYDRWSHNQNYMIIPNEIIDTINTQVWNTSNDDTSNLFPPNITSTLLGKISVVSNNKYEKLRMPIPRYYEPATDFSEDVPPEGETYWSEWPSYGELHNVSFQHGEIAIQISHMNNLQDSNNFFRRNFLNKRNDRWKLLNLQVDFQIRLKRRSIPFPPRRFMTYNAVEFSLFRKALKSILYLRFLITCLYRMTTMEGYSMTSKNSLTSIGISRIMRM